MRLNHIEKRYPCPPGALLHPSVLRIIYLPLNLLVCWAAVFFKARASGALPWISLLVATILILGILAVEVLISSHFTPDLIPAIFGFLAGAGVNVVFQGLLGKFQGLNWAFESPMQGSLGTVLFGFLGSLIFISFGEKIRKAFFSAGLPEITREERSLQRLLATLLWIITIIMAVALVVSLLIIQKQFNELESRNPLRQPLWFSAGAVILVLLLAAISRRNLFRLARVLLPGIVVGLVWASVVRNIFEGVYLAYPQFPLATEVFEFLLVVNLCYLGLAWLNKAAGSQD